MKKLESHESELIGEWIHEGGRVRGNDASERIQWLISEVLTLVGVDEKSGGWDKLYRDAADGRCWLLTYPQSEMHGGGPPVLKLLRLTDEEVKERFVSPEEWDKHMEHFMRDRNILFISPKDPPGE